MTTTGVASGGAPAAPIVGQTAGLALVLAEMPVYMDATVLLALALAEVHGLDVQDVEQRRTLALSVVLGDAGARFIEKVAGRTGPHWTRAVVDAVPLEAIRAANKVLGKNFVTKYGTKRGILALGRAVPLGIGAGIGGVGNAAIGYGSVRAARKVFGPAPDAWHGPRPAL